MFFTQPEKPVLKCPYCGRVVVEPAPGMNRHKVFVVRQGVFESGDFIVTCVGCRQQVGILIQY